MSYQPQPPDRKHLWHFDVAIRDWFYLNVRSERVYHSAAPRVVRPEDWQQSQPADAQSTPIAIRFPGFSKKAPSGTQQQPDDAQSATVATRLAGLSKKADFLLDKHQDVLSKLGLSVAFNRSTLATKYWLPLPSRNNFASGPNDGTSSSGRPLARALEDGVRCLDRVDEVATQSFAHTDGDDMEE